LAAATVVVIADRDPTGVAHALQVAQELRGTGSAVEVLQPAIGNDVSDHVGAGLSRDELEILPEGVENEFTRFVELLGGFDPTLPEYMLWQMTEVLLTERAESARSETSAEFSGDADQLFQELRTWRSAKAREEGVPAFIVSHDRTLRELVGRRPRNHQELLEVWGIGPARAERYGDELLQILWGEPPRGGL
jgi:superfamily II DNA helicase RecQ